MKRITIISAAVVVLFLAAFVIVRAETRGRHGWHGHHWHHFGPVSYWAHQLKLSDAQRGQIRVLWQAERPVVSERIHEFAAENREMSGLAGQSNPDPAKVQEIATREAGTLAALLVEKARLQSKIYSTVFDPKQREKADELQRKFDSRLDRLADRLATGSAPKEAPPR